MAIKAVEVNECLLRGCVKGNRNREDTPMDHM